MASLDDDSEGCSALGKGFEHLVCALGGVENGMYIIYDHFVVLGLS